MKALLCHIYRTTARGHHLSPFIEDFLCKLFSWVKVLLPILAVFLYLHYSSFLHLTVIHEFNQDEGIYVNKFNMFWTFQETFLT